MTVFNARALASLVTVADSALSKRLTVILSALVKVVEDDKDVELLSAVDEALRALFGSINDPEGLNTIMLLLLGWSVSRSSVQAEIDVFPGPNMNPRNAVSALATSLAAFAKNLNWMPPSTVWIGYGSLYQL